MTDQELNEIEERANAATPKIWSYGSRRRFLFIESETYDIAVMSGSDFGVHSQDFVQAMANAKFICKAREDIPALVAEVRQLRAERDVIIKELVCYASCPDKTGVGCLRPKPRHADHICGFASCWLEWARHEVEKAEKS